MKKLLFLLFIPIGCFAAKTNETADFAAKMGLVLPEPGVHVRPISAMSSKLTPDEKNNVLIAHKKIQTMGYYETENGKVKTMLQMRTQHALSPGLNNPQDTKLKSRIEDVGLAFRFQGVPDVTDENIVGYAAIGAYIKNGWTGITELFTDQELGVCQYDLYNIKLTHGAVFIPQELVSYDVNHKPTLIDVRGNTRSGFMYKVHWADNKSMNDLYCAHMQFDKHKTDRLIELAKKIDKTLEAF